uniref:Uncharacterized protein n=1 Tax=Parascaris equorum TaxID=6256 RepID=A0A914R9R2_PAREQ
MADKMPGGTLATERVLLATNVYGVRLPNIPGTLRHVLTLSQEVLQSLEMGGVEKVEFTVSDISGDSGLVLSDIAKISSDLSYSDRSLMQFIDIATSQYALFHPDHHLVFGRGVSYLQKPWEEGFTQEDCPSLPEGKYVCVGAHKSAGRVEGPKGRGSCNAAIIIDS